MQWGNKSNIASATNDKGESIYYKSIGTCSLCGGPVRIQMGYPGGAGLQHERQDTEHCGDCGATPLNKHGPVIPMQAKAN